MPMEERVVLITGSTDGLGRATAHKFAGEGYTVLIHGRSAQRCLETKEEILGKHPGALLRWYTADFVRLGDIFRLIAEFKAREQRLDVLINNAGIGIEDERRLTEDGLELTLQVNYLASYALCISLAPLLASSRGRAIFVSSSSQAPIDFHDPNYERDWDGIEAYGRSKWAQVALAAALAKRGRDQAMTIYAVHPGSFMPTKLVVGRFPVVDDLSNGVQALWSLATCRNVASTNGGYFEGQQPALALPSVYDESIHEQLISMSESMLDSAAIVSDGPNWKDLRAAVRA